MQSQTHDQNKHVAAFLINGTYTKYDLHADYVYMCVGISRWGD